MSSSWSMGIWPQYDTNHVHNSFDVLYVQLGQVIFCCQIRDRYLYRYPWWRHQMEAFSVLLALCVRNSPVTGEFPSQKPVTQSFDVFYDLCPNKRLSKQWWGWWLETPSRPLWRHCNATIRHNNNIVMKHWYSVIMIFEILCCNKGHILYLSLLDVRAYHSYMLSNKWIYGNHECLMCPLTRSRIHSKW